MTEEVQTPESEEAPIVATVKNPAGLLAKNKELLAKTAELSGRIAELEAQAQSTATEYEELKSKFSDFHIRRPMAKLAEEISPIPDLWLAEFQKHFDVRAVGDDLGIFTKDGERCTIPKNYIGGGKPVEFTAKSVWYMLEWYVPDRTAPEVRRWRAMMRCLGPTGSGATVSSQSFGPISYKNEPDTKPDTPSSHSFGLR